MSVSTGSIWLQSLLRSAWSLVLRDMLMGGGVGVLCSDFFCSYSYFDSLARFM